MLKVLLAEDDRTLVSLLKTLLSMEGFQVITLAGATSDILEVIRSEKPDIVLMDVFLGAENGIEILRKLRQMPDLSKMKVIMSSGMELQDECLAAGANDFLLKPYMLDDLLKMLKSNSSKTYLVGKTCAPPDPDT
ncbi:MAG: response regulator [Anaerolineales bacterium]|nr:response regulator [Anaerolineales bacterium]